MESDARLITATCFSFPLLIMPAFIYARLAQENTHMPTLRLKAMGNLYCVWVRALVWDHRRQFRSQFQVLSIYVAEYDLQHNILLCICHCVVRRLHILRWSWSHWENHVAIFRIDFRDNCPNFGQPSANTCVIVFTIIHYDQRLTQLIFVVFSSAVFIGFLLS